jgi:hypothetical protein
VQPVKKKAVKPAAAGRTVKKAVPAKKGSVKASLPKTSAGSGPGAKPASKTARKPAAGKTPAKKGSAVKVTPKAAPRKPSRRGSPSPRKTTK